ncbi:zinc-finger-containing protein [Janthinobacterium sp. 78]|uniref:zinc-finger-containing protein n=1 Tax=Janthinobacterium sp. 78 TaxID=2135631 RepID=UPI000D5ED296|nr:zinc-finger-containing protein [Janthinobacterium sp. 78]PVX36828.1 uncharacterized protein DUF3268 [Janthinobacterium sp. 78]
MIGAMQKALIEIGMLKPRSGPVTPQNPSRRAVARVKNPLPAPTECPNCGAPVELINNSAIYAGRQFGEWPWVYKCTCKECDSYVGLHPFTAIPLGTLADARLRRARKQAKDAFNPMWQSGEMTRDAAYAWLAASLGIGDVNECHIGWFDVAMCARAVAVCDPDGSGKQTVATDDLLALIAKVRQMQRNFELCLTSKQDDWLEDILDSAESGAPRVSANGRKFLETCASGFYSDGVAP